jgi:hypothetical protein
LEHAGPELHLTIAPAVCRRRSHPASSPNLREV